MSATDVIDVGADVPPVEPLGEPPAHPDDAAGKRGPGRPKGSKTNPDTLAAAQRMTGRPQTKKAGRPSNAARSDAELIEQLAGGYEFIGQSLVTLRVFRNKVPVSVRPQLDRLAMIGQAMKVNADECAASIVAYSNKAPRLRRYLERSGQGAGLLAIVVAHYPLFAAAFGDRADVEAVAPSTVGAPPEFSLADAMSLAAQMFPDGIPGMEFMTPPAAAPVDGI